MTAKPTAPTCIVVGCDEVSCLADIAEGMFWSFEAAYCSKCYLELQAGVAHEIDRSRLTLRFRAPTTQTLLG